MACQGLAIQAACNPLSQDTPRKLILQPRRCSYELRHLRVFHDTSLSFFLLGYVLFEFCDVFSHEIA